MLLGKCCELRTAILQTTFSKTCACVSFNLPTSEMVPTPSLSNPPSGKRKTKSERLHESTYSSSLLSTVLLNTQRERRGSGLKVRLWETEHQPTTELDTYDIVFSCWESDSHVTASNSVSYHWGCDHCVPQTAALEGRAWILIVTSEVTCFSKIPWCRETDLHTVCCKHIKVLYVTKEN